MRAVLGWVLAALAATGGLALAAVALPAPAPVSAVAAPGAVEVADLSVPDPELRPVVALARGPEVLGLALGPAPARVLAVPRDAPADLDPAALRPTGRTFAFADPHGNAWEVLEYEAPWGFAYGAATGPVTVDPHGGAYNVVLLVDATRVGPAVRLVAA